MKDESFDKAHKLKYPKFNSYSRNHSIYLRLKYVKDNRIINIYYNTLFHGIIRLTQSFDHQHFFKNEGSWSFDHLNKIY